MNQISEEKTWVDFTKESLSFKAEKWENPFEEVGLLGIKSIGQVHC